MNREISVEKRETSEGWNFAVKIIGGSTKTQHYVTLSRESRERIVGAKIMPDELVEKSFEFLLEREPKESILRKFDIELIGMYFPEYQSEIVKRLSRRL